MFQTQKGILPKKGLRKLIEGGLNMDATDRNKDEFAAYEYMLLKNLAVQDALVILATYAAQLDLQQDCGEEIGRIEAILEQCPVCVLEKGGILTRIHQYLNVMKTVQPLKAVEMAAKTLTPNFREMAFELAVKVALKNNVLTREKNEALDTIAHTLAVDKEYVKRISKKYI